MGGAYQASNMKKINLQDILKIETLGDDARVVLLHMKSRTWRLSLPKDALQFAMAIQRNMKVGSGIAGKRDGVGGGSDSCGWGWGGW